jgi:cell wall-associated NlpC family hydrolase
VTDAERLALALPFVGVPWSPRGEAPPAWNCWGCVRYLRRLIFGKDSPSFAEAYNAADVADLARVETLISERLGSWTPVAPRPGAVLLFEQFGSVCHVGLVLTRADFVHTLGGTETTICRMRDQRWSRRMRGAYDTADQDRNLSLP